MSTPNPILGADQIYEMFTEADPDLQRTVYRQCLDLEEAIEQWANRSNGTIASPLMANPVNKKTVADDERDFAAGRIRAWIQRDMQQAPDNGDGTRFPTPDMQRKLFERVESDILTRREEIAARHLVTAGRWFGNPNETSNMMGGGPLTYHGWDDEIALETYRRCTDGHSTFNGLAGMAKTIIQFWAHDDGGETDSRIEYMLKHTNKVDNLGGAEQQILEWLLEWRGSPKGQRKDQNPKQTYTFLGLILEGMAKTTPNATAMEQTFKGILGGYPPEAFLFKNHTGQRNLDLLSVIQAKLPGTGKRSEHLDLLISAIMTMEIDNQAAHRTTRNAGTIQHGNPAGNQGRVRNGLT